MRSFSDFNIKTESKSFEGDKIKIDRILNKEIEVHKFKIETSKFPEKGNGKRLDMEIVVDGIKRVVFSASKTLQEMIQKVPETEFPFRTKIVKENERLEFT